MRALSDGLFDPRIGPLVALWGFDDMAHTTPTQPPDEDSVAALRAQTLGGAEAHLDADVLWATPRCRSISTASPKAGRSPPAPRSCSHTASPTR